MLSYQWQGIEEALGRIGRLAAMTGLDSDLESAADDIIPELKKEPPERAGQKYVRTHNLRDSWRRAEARRVVGALSVDVENAMSYAPVVQGEGQAPIHQGRWPTVRKVAEEKRGAVRARVQGWALKTWRGG